MVHNFGTMLMPGLRQKIKKDLDHFNRLKMLCCFSIKAKSEDEAYLSWPNDYVSDVVKNMSSINVNKIPEYWVGVKEYKKLYASMNAQPYTGNSTIITLSKYPVREIFVTGFSFYLDGDTNKELYVPGHMDSLTLSRKKEKGWMHGSHGGEAQNLRQMRTVRHVILSNSDIFVLDSKVKDLLNIN